VLTVIFFGKCRLVENNYFYSIAQQPEFKEISCEELIYLIEKYPQKIKLVDTRYEDDYKVSRIQNSILYEKNRDTIFEEDKILIFYSDIGEQSGRVLKHFIYSEKGGKRYSKSYNLNGGILAWINAGRKIVNDEGITNKIHIEDRYRMFLPENYIPVK